MASHIKIVAILLLVQGAFEVLMGAIFAAIGPLILGLTKWTSSTSGTSHSPADLLPAGIMTGVYLALGLPVLALGIFRIIAGVRNLSYRGRTLGMVALAAGAISIMTCYCLPTSIGLMVYGLIVYADGQSRQAFALGEQGRPPDAILSEVSRPPNVGQPSEGRFG